APSGCHEHPSNGGHVIIPPFLDHFFDEGVPAFFAVAFAILPYFVDPPRRVMVVMGPTEKSAPSGTLDRRLSREVHTPTGSLFTPRSLGGQIGNNLPDGGCGHEFLRRTSVPRVSGAMVIDANPPVGQHIDALNSVDRRSLRRIRHRTTIRRRGRHALGVSRGRVDHGLPALS